MKTTPDAFQVAYNTLNTEQQRAVDTIEGPVMVVAGPGTGKTQILTLRIANILQKTDTAPEQILALTFTEAAAQNMRSRLAKLIGSAAYRVVINTFHGFCNSVIKRYPEDFPRIIGSKSITEIDQVAIVEEIIETESLVLLKPFGDRFLYVRDILSAISELKREGVTPEYFTELLGEEKKAFQEIPDLYHEKGPHVGKMKGDHQKQERKILKNEELQIVYARYQALLTERKQYDFNDMILEVLETLKKNGSLLQLLQEEHQYVLVDEHQDTNNAQNAILELLLNYHDNPNLFVVGDEKQAIFRFQGASLENFQYFKNKFPQVVLITLSHNYRSTQSILDTAGALLPGQTALIKNAAHTESKIVIGSFPSQASERYFVVHDIAKKISHGIPPAEIAILYRNNSHAFAIARDLERLGISYSIESDQDLFSDPDVRALLLILHALSDYGNDVHLAPLLHLPLFGIDPLDTYKLLRSVAEKKKYTLYDIVTSWELLSEINLKDTARIVAFGKKMHAWVTESRTRELLPFFEYIIRESGLLEEMLGSVNAIERFDAVNGLFDEVRLLTESRPEATLFDFFLYIETIKKHKLYLKRKKAGEHTDRVRLMTVHKSKGLEFSHVYIVHTVYGAFGGKIDRDRLPLIDRVYGVTENSIDADDERRLFYVALTRAKETVTITYALSDEQGRETLPSEFISELQDELIELLPTASPNAAFASDRGFQFSVVDSTRNTTLETKNFVRELFLRQGLSPTALNNYLECPWKYFYQNLIRIPQVQNKHQAYGTAVHGALADFFTALKKEPVEKSYLLAAFELWINKVSLGPSDFIETKVKGERALAGWYEAYKNSWNLRTQTEYRINGVLLNEEIKLTGVLDKIEWNDNNSITVVDYKTGKPKSRNVLLGKTKNADGNYYRQLTFYKLLLKYYCDGQYNMSAGVLDFIEPDEKGNYHKESFEIDEEEVQALEAEIIRVAEEILNLLFWETTCGDKDCEFCALRKLSK